MKPDPIVSVVMPVYNCERYLPAAVESVLRQSTGAFELVIVDDGSTDGSRVLLQAYEQRDQRIRIHLHEHLGVAAARNEGVRLARGEFLAVMDADDISEQDRLAHQLEFLAAHPECTALGGQVLYIDQDGDPLFRSSQPQEHDAIDAYHMSGKGSALPHSTVMFRLEAVRRVGGYREQFAPAEDFDLLLRLSETGRLANLDRVVARYRLHPDSLTSIALATQIGCTRNAIDEARERRGLGPLDIELPRPRQRTGLAEQLFRAMKAHDAGFGRSARKYAGLALRSAPLSTAAWRVALVVLWGSLRSRRST